MCVGESVCLCDRLGVSDRERECVTERVSVCV